MALQDDVRNLANNPTLGDLEPEALRLIAFSAETRILRAGDLLFRVDEVSDGGYVVLSGRIALETAGGPVSFVEPSALIGESALITETVRPCTAVAVEPTTILKISRSLFHRVLGEYPDSALRLRQALGERLITLRDDLDSLHRGLL